MRQTTSYLLEDALQAREKRNEYFQKGLDYLAGNAIRGSLMGKEMLFHWNINLYIDMAAKCNGKCGFCINRVNFSRRDITDPDYLSNLRLCFETIRFLDPSVQIVGGEPTLHKERLFSIIALIREYRLRKPILGTNGSGLIDPDLLDRIEPAFQHINISRHHFDDKRLRSIMGFENPLDNITLEKIIKHHPVGKKVRLNCCLLSEGICSKQDILSYLDWAMGMGIANVCFSSLSKLPGDYIYQEEFVAYTVRNSADFNRLVGETTADERFEFVKFHTGSHCMYEVWNYKNGGKSCTVVFSTSNNNFARMLDETDNLIEQLVFHTDGTLAGSWNRNCKVILQ